MRPTWHFVPPRDIRWLLGLTAARVHTGNAFMYRKLELDPEIRKKSYKVFEKSLRDNRYLTRPEIGTDFAKAGIQAEGMRLGYFIMSAELDGVICSGPRKGKQFTYALLEERSPQAKSLKQDEALAELTRRYFATRGPATLQDFTWWSGLTMSEARKGIELVRKQFVSEVLEEQTYWFDEAVTPVREKSPTVHLLPNYDEYFIGFKDRSAIGKLVSPFAPEENSVALSAHILIMNGQIIGGWRRTITKNAVTLERNLLVDLNRTQERALQQEVDRYSEFLQLPVDMVDA
jgi:hypothetical protein